MKYIYAFAFVLCLSVATHSQTIKTDEGRRIAAIDIEISKAQGEVNELLKMLDKLLIRFTTERAEVVAVNEKIAKSRQVILKLETEKKGLATKELVIKLPNTDIGLLKIIALQNERIIDLLEQLVKRPND